MGFELSSLFIISVLRTAGSVHSIDRLTSLLCWWFVGSVPFVALSVSSLPHLSIYCIHDLNTTTPSTATAVCQQLPTTTHSRFDYGTSIRGISSAWRRTWKARSRHQRSCSTQRLVFRQPPKFPNPLDQQPGLCRKQINTNLDRHSCFVQHTCRSHHGIQHPIRLLLVVETIWLHL